MDLFVANIDHEMFSLYQKERDEIFSDAAPRFGIASQTFTQRHGDEILRLRQRRQSRPDSLQWPSRTECGQDGVGRDV